MAMPLAAATSRRARGDRVAIGPPGLDWPGSGPGPACRFPTPAEVTNVMGGRMLGDTGPSDVADEPLHLHAKGRPSRRDGPWYRRRDATPTGSRRQPARC